MFVVGLTGGIGSGKTAVSDHFASLGITIVDADLASRVIVEPGRPALQAIAERFGPEIINADGSLNRAALRQIVFADPEERRWLEALTHPLIAEEIRRQLAASTSPYTLLVSPLLFESGQHYLTHRKLVVDAPEHLQVQRAATRDGVAETQIASIMQAQMAREKRLGLADDVVSNAGDLASLQQNVEQLHQHYLTLASGHQA